ILINLSGNAVKFTNEGSVSVSAERLTSDDDKVLLKVTVADTGIGIPPDKHREIFEAFSQADASTTRQFGGTGLGLSISSRLAKLMGGDISLDSQPGNGTRFYFIASFEAASHEEIPAPLAHPSLKGFRALVVDDHDVNRSLLQHLLPMWGMEVVLAASGEQALNIFAGVRGNPPFSVVLMDRNMPRMDGYETCSRLRALPEGRSI